MIFCTFLLAFLNLALAMAYVAKTQDRKIGTACLMLSGAFSNLALVLTLAGVI